MTETHNFEDIEISRGDDYGAYIRINLYSTFWGVVEADQIDMLKRAKESLVYLDDLEYIDNIPTRLLYKAACVGIIPKDVFDRLPDNPFISPVVMKHVRESIWESRQADAQKPYNHAEDLNKTHFRHITPKIRRMVIERDKAKCRYCEKELVDRDTVLDHVIPFSRGGENTIENLVVCCVSCNSRKRARTPSQAGMKLLEVPE